MSDFDNRDEEEKKETGLEENKGKEPSDKKEEKTDKPEKEYEDVCFICRRPESKAGKMYHLPNNICVCDDCMHRTMDAVSQYDYQGMLNNPEMMNMLNNMNKDGKYPNISFVNLADLQGNDGIPNKQKIKKKKEKEKRSKRVFTPPTLEEVQAYCRERGNRIDPQYFLDYYTSTGWMRGKVKLKDWKAAVRTWERQDAKWQGQTDDRRQGTSAPGAAAAAKNKALMNRRDLVGG